MAFFRNLSKTLLTNFLIIFSFIVLIELIFGYWFDKYNFGPYMREHRMKNQPTVFNYNGEIYTYNYKRNYYGFRGDDIEPSNIEAIIVGGSAIAERYKPDEFTITGYLNKNLEKNNYDLKIVNAAIEAQSTVGIIYNFKHWFTKLENFSPKLILFYIGIYDIGFPDDVDEENFFLFSNFGEYGHMISPDKTEIFFDNIKSRSFFYDSIRIFKFKFLPRKNFIRYDGNINPNLKDNFEYVNYDTALKNYDIELLKKKYETKINNYLSRVDIIYEKAKKINSNPIFITSVKGDGNTKINFIFNYSLISHCEKKKYNCINLAKKLEGKFNYWRNESHTHTSIKGSEIIANLIFEDLVKILKNQNLI